MEKQSEQLLKNHTLEELIELCNRYQRIGTADIQQVLIKFQEQYNQLKKERDEYALLIFQPSGETHHNANECPYCKENLNK